MTSEERNRFISESIEPNPFWTCGAMTDGKAYTVDPLGDSMNPRHWHTDESASGMLLELMPEPDLWLESDKGQPKLWGCVADLMEDDPDKSGTAFHTDRKTAIRDAAYEYLKAKASR